jgi:hypothetical protein
MPSGLQLIIGADDKNDFTVYRDRKNNQIQIFFGQGLYETIEDNKDNAEFKLLLARLYNSGVQVKTLIDNFGFSYPTYKRWGDALKSGDDNRIYWAFSGQGGGGKKLKPDIVAFIVHDFSYVYERNKYSYSKEILQDIKDVFGLKLSQECIRPLLGKLKKSFLKNQGLPEKEKKSIYKNHFQ